MSRDTHIDVRLSGAHTVVLHFTRTVSGLMEGPTADTCEKGGRPMADSQHRAVHPIVHEYLHAGEAILSDQPNANHAFILASQALIERDGLLTDDEQSLVQDILHRVAIKTMPSSGQESK